VNEFDEVVLPHVIGWDLEASHPADDNNLAGAGLKSFSQERLGEEVDESSRWNILGMNSF
jgi:hypothetical protein